jgi:cytochrome c oxidase assembly factor CtaG
MSKALPPAQHPRSRTRNSRSADAPRSPSADTPRRTRENARVTSARRPLARLAGPLVAALAFAPVAAAPVLAHGGEVPPPPDAAALLLGWSFQPETVVPLVLAAAAYLWAVRRVNAAHPGNPVPRDRPVFWLIGLACLAAALLSGIERYDTELFSVHMIQHALIVFGAGASLVLAAPITLLLRVASPEVRDRWILPVLRSRPVKIVSHPLVAWLLFTAVTWGSHLSPLFDAALEDPAIHYLEHALYLSTAMLFWWPVVGRDPSPWRLPYPARVGYVFLQMPLMSLLSVLILFSPQVIYPHYMTTGRTWLPTPLEDQQLAGALMWGIGDLAFLVAIFIVIAAWMRHEESATRRREAVEDARAARLAATGAAGDAVAGSPAGPPVGAPAGSAVGGQAEGIGAAR